jgi:hypothetical protein
METSGRMLSFFKEKENRQLAFRSWVTRYRAASKARASNAGP